MGHCSTLLSSNWSKLVDHCISPFSILIRSISHMELGIDGYESLLEVLLFSAINVFFVYAKICQISI